MYLMATGDTRQCGYVAGTVAQYLIERGFRVRADSGAGRYCSHFDLAVHTSDLGWVSVDPTAIQFHAPNNLSHALRIAKKNLDIDDIKKLSRTEKEAIIARFFEPTIQWSVISMLDGVKAFEVAPAPHIPANIPKEPTKATTPTEYVGYRSEDNWREYWAVYRDMADGLARGETDKLELHIEEEPGTKYPFGYWVEEVGRRIRGRRLSGSRLATP